MTVRLSASGRSAPATRFDLDLHETIESQGVHVSSAFAIKTGRLVTIEFCLVCFVDRTAVITQEPLIYIPDALAPVGLDDARDAPAHTGPWFICDANSVLGASYPRRWPMRFEPWWTPGGGAENGIYDTHGFDDLFSPIDGDEERVEVLGGFTYVALS